MSIYIQAEGRNQIWTETAKSYSKATSPCPLCPCGSADIWKSVWAWNKLSICAVVSVLSCSYRTVARFAQYKRCSHKTGVWKWNIKMQPKSCLHDYCMNCRLMLVERSFMSPGTVWKQNGAQPADPEATIRRGTGRSGSPVKRGYPSRNWLYNTDYRFILSERFFINSSSDCKTAASGTRGCCFPILPPCIKRFIPAAKLILIGS